MPAAAEGKKQKKQKRPQAAKRRAKRRTPKEPDAPIQPLSKNWTGLVRGEVTTGKQKRRALLNFGSANFDH